MHGVTDRLIIVVSEYLLVRNTVYNFFLFLVKNYWGDQTSVVTEYLCEEELGYSISFKFVYFYYFGGGGGGGVCSFPIFVMLVKLFCPRRVV